MAIGNRKIGSFQIIAYLVILPMLLGLLWCFYDAYWPRPLSLEAVYQVGGRGELIGRSDQRAVLHLPHPIPDKALIINLDNRSHFYLRRARVVFVVKDRAGEILNIEEVACLQLGSKTIHVPPRLASETSSQHCIAPLGKMSIRALANQNYGSHDWYFSELHGHRAPIRLIRRPLEIFSLMFERIYD